MATRSESEPFFHPEKEAFFADMERLHLALTFDDVRIRTRHNRYAPLPENLDLESKFSTNVGLRLPFVSAAMTSVTEAEMAIAMGKEGGLGVIHGAMSIEDQRRAVRKVKLDTNALIDRPVTVNEDNTLEDILKISENKGYDFRTFPVTDKEKRFVGLVTQSQFEFNQERMQVPVRELMIPESQVIRSASADMNVATAYELMVQHAIKTIPIVGEDKRLNGMYIFSDVSRIYHEHGRYNVDQQTGRLLVAAAVSTGPDVYERMAEIRKYTDVAVLDTADGDAHHVFNILERIKSEFSGLDVVVGNISDGESAYELAKAGADGIKVGQGPGSICSTRRETGIGMPQVTAVWDCVKALRDEYPHVPVCADGGIAEHGDIPIAIAAGARSVMMGKMLVGTTESPGPIMQRDDGSLYKEYWGMGSRKAQRENAASYKRYGDTGGKMPLPEGIESKVPYEGGLKDVLGLCVQALEKGMRYAKSPDLESHRRFARFKRITAAGLRESHPHDVEVTRQ